MAVHRIYIDGTWYLLPIPEKADTLEATGATDDNKFMTPKKTKQLIDSLDLGAISEVVTTGSGNAVTNITVSSDGKTLTATKGSTFSLTDHTHSLDGSGITGVLPISRGGTGATSASTARTALGLGSLALKSSLSPDDIPSLDAGKITSGTFNATRIPNLDAGKITTGTFNAARIPNLDAGKITTGTFSIARIPDLSTSKITDLGNIATKNLSSDFTWTGKHIFDMSPGNTNAIEFKTSFGASPKFTATIDAGQEGTYTGEWTLPAASGTLALSTHSHGNITNDGRIGSAANRVIVTGTGGVLIAKEPGGPNQFLSSNGSWATPTVDTTQDYTWTGLHSFSEPIRLTPNTAIYSLNAPGTGSGTVELPLNKSGTIALTSDIPDVIYGYCSTSASTTAKVVSSNTFTSHKAGQIYVIEFVNGNTATSPTININSTGAIGVRHLTTNGAVTTSPGTDIMYARSRTIWTFVYNGTYLIPIGKSTRYWNALETKMLSYSKGSSGSAITTSDTVSSAVGKLEYRLDNLSISNISGLQTALNAKVDKTSFSLSGTTLTITV